MKSTDGENGLVSDDLDESLDGKTNSSDVSKCSTEEGENSITENTIESGANKPSSPGASNNWNTGKCRKPNWTDIEVRTLILEYDRHRDVMVSKAVYDSDGQKKPKGEKQKVWRLITEAVNRSQVESVNLLGNTAVERTLKDVIKKWVNLVNKMKCDFATKRDNPKFIPCPTSLAINTILFTNDPLDLDVLPAIVRPQTKTPTPPPPWTPVPSETPVKTSVPSEIETSSSSGLSELKKDNQEKTSTEMNIMRTKYREIAPHPGVDNLPVAVTKPDNTGDNTQTQESLRQAILKRKASEIESPTDNSKSPGTSHERKPHQRRKGIPRPRVDLTPECNGTDLRFKQEIIHHDNNTMQIRFSLDDDNNPPINKLKNLNDAIKPTELRNGETELQQIGKGLVHDANKAVGHANNAGPLYNNMAHEHNGIEDGHVNHAPEFFNGDMYTDDFMQLNKEVLELKKHKLLMKINKLALEREKATNDKIRSEIEKDTARMINRKVRLELEKFEKSFEK